ncbi:hypothetical protein AM500_03245 [Bacillus sp. FJAT-18017]|uniref:TnsA endonuclease N-terminal domain-containing protein n=1 Tax=Bacillus sp. FJAT-18017 TaxID=1705566 RepID=UPI0006B04665|nr:DDE-type integrase/transposase/recombinase [Bacillus sp. FJAT-18017]ALC88924.1 hypothetical protein AM500_03245 [Bacillus sp. FJAT-18017]
MLTEAEFLNWCERNKVPLNIKEYINKNIRHSQPARLVQGGRDNLTGKYPSKKMGFTIQFESGKVEGPAILMLENDEDVLEYYDQPNKIRLSYLKDGKKRGFLYTPDFFVIRKDGAGWEEWKSEKDYRKISNEQEWRYTKDQDEQWRCPPGEEFANSLGLLFKVCSSKTINWNLHRNYVFLDDYIRKTKDLMIKEEALEDIKKVIFQEPGITLKKLIECSLDNHYRADDIFVSVLKNEIFINLNEAPLAEPELVKVFLHNEHALMYKNLTSCQEEVISPSYIKMDVGSTVLWDNHVWKIINIGTTSVSMLSDKKYNEISIDLFYKLINEEKLVCEKVQHLDNDPLIDRIVSASEEDYKVANYRITHVLNYLKNGSKAYSNNTEPNLRKVRDWAGKYSAAKTIYGNGYPGLLPKDKRKGNRTPRFNSEVITLMNDYIIDEYENIVQKKKSVVYGLFKNACEEKGYIAPSLVTFCECINKRPIEEQTNNRKGKRAEYQVQTFYWELERTTPRHGDFPFNIAHLDHTQLDIELVSSKTKKKLGKPYLSLLVDAFSRKVLAFYLSFEPPSYRSCMMVFRDCVRRFNRLPQQIVVDNGKEFHSVYFEALLAMYEREPKWRPPAKARYGSILERLFGTTNTNFIQNLTGNTQIMKNVREVTQSVNPKNHAAWSLPNLSAALDVYFFELYETIEHPALGQTPREAFSSGLFYSGDRKDFHISYDNVFEIMTLPSTLSGEATVQKSGVKINYIYYWNDVFKSLHQLKTKVKVRFDPFNLGIAYAFVKGRWVKCISQYYSIFKSLTQKELKFITAELKKSNQNHARNFTINAQKIAKFLKDMESNNSYELLRERAEETKKVIHLDFNNAEENIENEKKIVNQPQPSKKSEDLDLNQDSLEIYGEF